MTVTSDRQTPASSNCTLQKKGMSENKMKTLNLEKKVLT